MTLAFESHSQLNLREYQETASLTRRASNSREDFHDIRQMRPHQLEAVRRLLRDET